MKKYVFPLLLAVTFGVVLGALGYCGLVHLSCFFDSSPVRHPVAYPVSLVGMVGCMLLLAVVGWFYGRLRKRHPSVPMTVADVLLALAVVLPSLMAWGKLVQLLFAQ